MYKQIIIVRSDLKLGKGKMIAQALHAAIGSLESSKDAVVKRWEAGGAKKIALKSDLKKLKLVESQLKKEKIPYFLVKDAGLTQIKAGTITALGIGPIEEEKIDKITRSLRLL